MFSVGRNKRRIVELSGSSELALHMYFLHPCVAEVWWALIADIFSRCHHWLSQRWALSAKPNVRKILDLDDKKTAGDGRPPSADLESRSIEPSNPIGSAMLNDEAGGTIRADVHGHSSPKEETRLRSLRICLG